MRYFLQLAYDGAPFHGWQSQPNAPSVQATIEAALSKILRQPVSITGAGRTDTGVHARRMFAHFDVDTIIPQKDRFLLSLNSMVGKDVAVSRVFKVEENAHARFDATSRTYKYFVTYSKNPFLYHLSWHTPSNLDLEAMNECCAILKETKDFTSFAKLHSDAKTNICDVTHAGWKKIEDDEEASRFMGTLEGGIVFTITADRFLRNMVRAIVGTLVEVGRGKLSPSGFREIIADKDRCSAGTSMPAHALFLWDITYKFLPS